MNKNGAEVLVKNLAPGANEAALAKAERKLGFALPAELVELWRLHDVPFGTRDSDHLVIHAGTGRVFRVAKDAPPLSLAAKSLTEFFERYVKGMEKGEYTVEEGFGDVYLAS